MGFLLARAEIDGRTQYSVLAESALPHLPAWTAVEPRLVRTNPWDFEEPTDDATPDVGPADTALETVELPDDVDAPPAGNASAAEWRAYAQARDVADVDTYSRDELRDHFLNDQPLPSEEN